MSIICARNDKFFKYENGIVQKVDNVSSKDIITSTLKIKDVISYTFKLPLSKSEEEIEAEAEMQFFDNAGVDANSEYKLNFVKKELKDEESYVIEAIAISEDSLKTKFQSLVEKVKHIDFISCEMFSFSEFYKVYEKEPQRDVFIYLDEKESFIVAFDKGEYLYAKHLTSLNSFLKTLSLDYDEFIKVVSEKGLSKEKYEIDETLLADNIDKFFSEYFIAVNNRISYGRSVFYLDNIDNAYFYTPFHIEGLETLNKFWEMSGINFEKIPVREINFLDEMVTIYNNNHYKDSFNFSIFPRPPKFYKTKSFYLALLITATFGGFGGDVYLRYEENSYLKNEINKLKKQIKIKETKLNKLKMINRIILDEMEKYNSEITSIENKISTMKQILEKSLELTQLDKTDTDMILITKLLKKNRLQAFSISKDENGTFEIGVYTDFINRREIGAFMNDLYAKQYKEIRTNRIYNLTDKVYMSLIRFKK